jgi:thiamine-monophosphate kinase
MPGEFDFIRWVASQVKASPFVVVPPGDDLAVLKWDSADLLLVGVDQVLDGVHFDSKIHSPRQIGRKAMNRNLSDCAAMACLPAAAVCTVALPKGSGEAYARELHAGMVEAAAAFDCPIVGGDTGSWPGKLVVTVTILGRSAGVKPVTRAGAKPGDQLYVTGPLGGSLFGRHLSFEPRVKLARYLATNFRIHAMIDLSDGLGVDLRNLCTASGVGATIEAERLPIHEDVKRHNDAKLPIVHAMADGEDYELLIASPDDLPDPCVCVGRFDSNKGLRLATGSAEVAFDESEWGWEHEL